MDVSGYTEKVCFCRVHGNIISQTLPRQVSHHDKSDSSLESQINFQRSRVLQNAIKGAFNTQSSESIEDLTNRFDGIAQQDPNLTSQVSEGRTQHPELCSYKHYDTVDHDVHINTIASTYIDNDPINVTSQNEYSEFGARKASHSPSYYQCCQENYYDPVHCDDHLSQLVMPNGSYIHQNQNFQQLSSTHIFAIDTRSNHLQKDRRSKSKERKSKGRREGNKDIVHDEQYIASYHHTSSNSRSAPSSPAQNSSKSRRRRREYHSHKPNLKKVTIIHIHFTVILYIYIS